MNKPIILITGGCSARTLKLLKAFADFSVLLGDYGEVPAIQSTGYHFVTLGKLNNMAIAHNLLNRCLDHSADILIPVHIFEIEAVAKASLLFEEFGITILLPEPGHLDNFFNPGTGITKEFIVLHKGKQIYPAEKSVYFESLSGVFYTDEQGNPIKLFTLE